MVGLEGSHHILSFHPQVKCLCGLLWFWLSRDTLLSANQWVVSNSQPLMPEQVVHSPGSWQPPVLSLPWSAGQGNSFSPNNRSRPLLTISN